MTRAPSSQAPSNADTSARSEPPHALPVGEVLARFGVDAERGLNESEVEARRAESGPNQLAEQPPSPRWRRFLGQFLEPVIGILIAAAVIAGLMGELIDTLAILAIVILNGVLGFIQEDRAERALGSPTAALRPDFQGLTGGPAAIGSGTRPRARRSDRTGSRR